MTIDASDAAEIPNRFIERDDVGVFGVHVEEALVVGGGGTVADASRTTMGRKPVWTLSTTVARTQPLVVQPVMISVSTP